MKSTLLIPTKKAISNSWCVALEVAEKISTSSFTLARKRARFSGLWESSQLKPTTPPAPKLGPVISVLEAKEIEPPVAPATTCVMTSCLLELHILFIAQRSLFPRRYGLNDIMKLKSLAGICLDRLCLHL